MRVLHVYKDSYPPIVGGIERHIHAIREALPEVEQDVLVCARSPRTRVIGAPAGGRGRDTLVAEFGRILSVPVAPTFPRWVRRLAAGAVVHVHMPNPLAELSIVMLPRAIPVVASYHADVYRQRHLLPVYAPLVRRCLRRANAVLTGSVQLRDGSSLLRSAGVRAEVVPYAIDVHHWAGAHADATRIAQLQETYGGPFVLAVGRLVSYKGFDRLINAARDLPWHVVIIGDGPLRAELEAQIRDHQLQERVHLIGRLNDDALRDHFAAAGLFVLPSVNRAEAFGVVLLEAQAAGIPVIATDTGTGTPEAFEPGGSGILVPANDEDALKDAMLALIRDPGRRRQFGAAGAERVRRQNSLEALARRLGPLYTSLAESIRHGSA